MSGSRETPAHIRAILPRVRSSTDILLRLRSAANRFDGTDTVSALPFPVRIGIDNVFRVEGSGLLVAGWLLDPDSHVEGVKLRRHRGEIQIDTTWTRIDRPDVTREFDNQPRSMLALTLADMLMALWHLLRNLMVTVPHPST